MGVYVCVMDSDKNDQTTYINVVNCKIVTETCQLFFCVRCVSAIFCHRYLRRCGFGLSRLVVRVASETRSYKYKRFPSPSFRAISCKRVYASKASIALMYYIIPHQQYDVKIFFRKFAFGVKFMQKSAKHI